MRAIPIRSSLLNSSHANSSPPFPIRQIHHPRFQFASASSIHHMRAIPIRPTLLNSSHANSSPSIPIRQIHHPQSNSPQPPQFITCERFQFAPASSIHHTRIHHPRLQFAVLLYMYNSTHSPLPPLIRPCLPTSSHSPLPPRIQFAVLLYVYNNKIMTLTYYTHTTIK